VASAVAPRRRTSLPVAVTTWAGGRVVTLLLLALSSWGLWAVHNGAYWRVQWVEVIGCRFVSAESIVAASGLANAWSVSLVPADVAERLEAMPAVLDAGVEVVSPSRVRVTVQEDPPVLVVRAGDQDYWVTDGGRVSAAAEAATDLPVVAVSGDWAPAAVQTVLSGFRALSAAFPEGVASADGGQKQFDYDATHGYVLTSTLGCPVYLGDAGDLEQQLALLAALEAELSAKGVKPQYISLISVEGAYYR
jgi:cell division septal protein FtsQ